MEKTALLLVILSAAIHACRGFLTKKAGDKEIFIWLYQIFALLFFLPPFVYFLLKEGLKSPNAFYFIALSGFIHFLYWLFMARSFEKGDLSLVYPIMRSSPALVLLFSILALDENVSLAGGVGVVLTAMGVYTINMRGLSLDHLLEPILAIRRNPSIKYAFLTLFTVTAYTLIDKVAVEYVHPVLFIYLFIAWAYLFFTPCILIRKRKPAIVQEWQANKKIIITTGILSIVGYSLILFAFTIERVSYITGLRQLSVVFAVLLGGHLLKEEHKSIRLLGASFIFAGAFLISLSS